MHVSYSRLDKYALCPEAHYRAYIERITPNKPIRPLWFGGNFHTLLEHRNNPQQLKKARREIVAQFKELSPAGVEELGDDYIDALRTIFQDYNRVWAGTEQPVITEHPFLIKLGRFRGEPVHLKGVIDEIYSDEGYETLGEHKTFKGAPPDRAAMVMNMQTGIYAKARQLEIGRLPTHVQWDYIKSVPAKYPIWLEKSKRFSTAKNQQITPFSFERACKKQELATGMSMADQLPLAHAYDANISNFFFRYPVEVIRERVERVWSDTLDLARECITRGETNRRQYMGRHCSWCSYRPLCYAECTGADIDYIIKHDFKEKEDRDEEHIIEADT